jgi:Beta-lactamase
LISVKVYLIALQLIFFFIFSFLKVNHVLNHTAGLQNAMGDVMKDDPLLMCDWEESLNRISESTPDAEPGSLQFYHYLSFGWLCGGIIEVSFTDPLAYLILIGVVRLLILIMKICG